MIKVNALRYEKDRRCASCVHCLHFGELNDFDDADDYECAIYREGYADCESVYKNICKGKKFRNAEPINKLFPRLPIHVIAIKQEEVWRGLNHFRVAGLVFVLATLAMGIRMLFAI
jgi:hypothetical protein